MSKLTFYINTFSFALFLVVTFSSCSNDGYTSAIKRTLKEAKENRHELEEVLHHYKAADDELKLKAAIFLIENMYGRHVIDTNSFGNEIYFDLLDSLNRVTDGKITSDLIYKHIDSLNRTQKLTSQHNAVRYVNESQVLNAEFLIDNIDKAFFIWQSAPWSKEVNFDTFCEYILPYSCNGRFMHGFRDVFINKYQRLIDTCNHITNPFYISDLINQEIDSWFLEDPSLFANHYPYLQPILFSNILRGKVGVCNDINTLRVLALRSLGIPTAFEWLPNWGNSNSSHFWYKIIDSKYDTVHSKILNLNVPSHTEHIISGSSYPLPETTKGVPDHIQIGYIRTVAKVYRETFKKSSQWANHNLKDIESQWHHQMIKSEDVTERYVDVADVSFEIDKKTSSKKHVYLLCFDNQRWTPVGTGVWQGNTVSFKNIGKNVVFLPAIYDDNSYRPIAPPFCFTRSGDIRLFEHDPDKTQQVNLYMKFPYRSFIALWASFMIGTKFQGANLPNLSDTTTLFEIDDVPFYKNTVKITDNTKYRYLLYQFKGAKYQRADMAEVEFRFKDNKYDHNGLKPFGNQGFYHASIDNTLDKNTVTYFERNLGDPTTYIGYDLGKGNELSVSEIMFYPRNDNNEVEKGEDYELFYWDDHWKSLGKREGNENGFVTFSNAPPNALLLLVNVNKGKENRIFTYEEGRQYFW